MTIRFAAIQADTRPLIAVHADEVEKHLRTLPERDATWLRATGFDGEIGSLGLIGDTCGALNAAYIGLGTKGQKRVRFAIASALGKLPAGSYQIKCALEGADLDEMALALLLSGYRFDRYKSSSNNNVFFVAPKSIDVARIEAMAQGEFLSRDLINTPACDMGPNELESAARALADQHEAAIDVIADQDVLACEFPLIHAVGRASTRKPRLIDIRWGAAGPKLTLVGKGVCFDTGGLNLKSGASMGLMKKDMGGAATVLGLAHMIMALKLPLQLRVLIPAVENAVSGNAFRPGDVLPSRKGLSVEINNTDAEGRLVLADALTLAAEDSPDHILSMATLTGAARVAVGPDLAPFYTNDPKMAAALPLAAARSADPVWQMPFHDPYEAMIEPQIADLDNAPSGGFAGSITAALFLRRFAGAGPYTHFDIYGWNPLAAPARPKGGAGQGARAVLGALHDVLGL